MNIDKWFGFEQRWRELEAARKEYDFRKSEWCRDVRAEWPRGDAGDKQFCGWLTSRLGVSEIAAREMLTRAIAATVVKDEKTWNQIGGFRAVRPLADYEVSRKQAVEVLEIAKSEARAPVNVMRKMGLIPAPVPRETPKAKPDVFPVKPQAPKPDVYLDAVALAQYIAKTNRSIPKDILAIVNRYREFMRKAA